jgi:hypothetical protein
MPSQGMCSCLTVFGHTTPCEHLDYEFSENDIHFNRHVTDMYLRCMKNSNHLIAFTG